MEILGREGEGAVVYDIQYDIEYDNSEDYSSSSCDPSVSQSKNHENELQVNFDIKCLPGSKPFISAYHEEFELAFPSAQKKDFCNENFVLPKMENDQFGILNNLLEQNLTQHYESDISAGSDDEPNMLNHESMSHITLDIQENL